MNDATAAADLTIPGALRVRLLGGTPGDWKRVAHQCGLPVEAPALDVEADFALRFASSVSNGEVTYVGRNFAGFDDEAFYVVHHKSGEAALRLPFGLLGGACEVLCKSGLPSIPLLNDLLILYAQFNGFAALHGSAFEYRGRRLLVAGWAKGGKTEALLAFGNHGAAYLGDECVLLAPGGEAMLALPMPVTVSSRVASQVAGGRARPGLSVRLMWGAVRALAGLHQLRTRVFPRSSGSLTLLDRALPVLEQAARVQVPVGRLFSRMRTGTNPGPDAVFLMLGHSRSGVRVQAIEPSEVAARMQHSHAFEQLHLMQYYHAYRFAFPQSRNPRLEALAETQAGLLGPALAGRPAFMVEHCYPADLECLFESMRAHCEGQPPRSGGGRAVRSDSCGPIAGALEKLLPGRPAG